MIPAIFYSVRGKTTETVKRQVVPGVRSKEGTNRGSMGDLSKSVECAAPRTNPNVNYGL